MTRNDVLKAIENNGFSLDELVSIFELIENKLTIGTYSHVARLENKTPKGIEVSKKYRKIKIGDTKMAIAGISGNNLPF